MRLFFPIFKHCSNHHLLIKVCFSNEKKLSLFPWDPPCHWKKMTLQGLYIAIGDTVCVKACFYEAQKVFSREKATQVLLATLFCCCWGHLFSHRKTLLKCNTWIFMILKNGCGSAISYCIFLAFWGQKTSHDELLEKLRKHLRNSFKKVNTVFEKSFSVSYCK